MAKKAALPKAKAQEGTITIKAEELAAHLEKVHLGGLIGECVLVCEGDQVSTTAVDLTNSVFLSIQTPINMNNLGTIGLGNLSIMTKFIEMMTGDIIINESGHKLSIKPTGEGPSLKYLLALPDYVSTYDAGHSDALETLKEQNPYEAEIPKAAVEGYIQMMGLLKAKSGIFSAAPGANMTLTGGLETEHQFSVDLGPAPDDLDQPFTLGFYAEHLRAVLATVKEKDLFFKFGPERPILVSVIEEDSWWALLPARE